MPEKRGEVPPPESIEQAVSRIQKMREAKDRGEISEEAVIAAVDKYILDFGFKGLVLLDKKDKEKK